MTRRGYIVCWPCRLFHSRLYKVFKYIDILFDYYMSFSKVVALYAILFHINFSHLYLWRRRILQHLHKSRSMTLSQCLHEPHIYDDDYHHMMP